MSQPLTVGDEVVVDLSAHIMAFVGLDEPPVIAEQHGLRAEVKAVRHYSFGTQVSVLCEDGVTRGYAIDDVRRTND